MMARSLIAFWRNGENPRGPSRSPRACAGETAGWRRLRFISGHNLPAEDFRAGSGRPPQQAGSNQQAALHLNNLLMVVLGSLKLMRKRLPARLLQLLENAVKARSGVQR